MATETMYTGSTGEYVLTDAEVDKFNKMCPAAAAGQLGTLLKVVIQALNEINGRLDLGGHT